MARPKRPDGTLQDNVLRLLRDEARPLSGTELTELLGKGSYVVPSSLVFRAIRRLLDRNAIKKIQLASGYVIRGPASRVSLCCSRCGAWDEITDDLSFAGLDAAAQELGFTVSNRIIEAAGTCGRCRAFDESGRSRLTPPQADMTPPGPLAREAEVAGGRGVGAEESCTAVLPDRGAPVQSKKA
jgi:Fe2+ or Zn2+ uptake regulation protein